ncbi:sec-independent protein translocase protein TatB [Agrobacterium vitis]|nr:sec-independent protein translocase protein TatB [Agrobacterium vitis]MBE1437670.1 sec-independent protein translocase protein TatB [Agrobacterium vitis]
MLDIGWSELLVIAVVLIVVVGPKDLPPMLRAFGKMTTRLRKTAGEFRAQFDEALREADMDDLRQTIGDAQKLNPANALREAINPLRQMGADIKADLQRSTQVDHFPEADVSGIASADEPLVPMTPADLPPLGALGDPDAALFAPVAAKATPVPAATSMPAAMSAPVATPASAAPSEPVVAPVAKPRRRTAKAVEVSAEPDAGAAKPVRSRAKTATATSEAPVRAKRSAAVKAASAEAAAKPKNAVKKKPSVKKTVVKTPEGKDEA